nr:GAF domain-containing protein [Desulfobacula sp.]
MEDQTRLQTILMNIAAQYINIGLAEVEDTLSLTLGEMAAFVEADRAYIFDYDWNAGTCSNTYEWCSKGTSPEIEHLQDVPLDGIRQWADAHKGGKTMYIPEVSALPEGDGVRQILEPQQVKSLIAIPIMDKTHCTGFIGFDSVKTHHVYSEKERSLLLLFAEMIVNVRNRQKSDQALQNYSAELETKNIQLDNALALAEAARKTKSEFLANVSHEIRTPMNAIIGFTDMLEKTGLDKQQQGYVLKINRAADDLLKIINRLFDFSKMQDRTLVIEKRDFNLDEVLKKATRTAEKKAREKGIGYTLEKDAAVPPFLKGDPTRLGQAILNLVDNAVKFTEKGEIRIRVRCEGQDKNKVSLGFYIEDTGIGMTEAQTGRLFCPFTQADASVTRKYEGMGLGLVIVKNSIELMNGNISVQSEHGRGSCFCFFIPFEKGDPAGAGRTPGIDAEETKISPPGKTKPLLSPKALKEKMAVLRDLLEGYDTASVDLIEQITDSASKAGMEKEILDLEKKAAAYNFDAALEILNKILKTPDSV